MARPRTKAERLFSAAVVRRSFELQDRDYAAGFRFVYEGVLRDLELDPVAIADRPPVVDLRAHRGQAEPVLVEKGRVVDAHDMAEVLLHADVAEMQIAGVVDDPRRIEVPETHLEPEPMRLRHGARV